MREILVRQLGVAMMMSPDRLQQAPVGARPPAEPGGEGRRYLGQGRESVPRGTRRRRRRRRRGGPGGTGFVEC